MFIDLEDGYGGDITKSGPTQTIHWYYGDMAKRLAIIQINNALEGNPNKEIKRKQLVIFFF